MKSKRARIVLRLAAALCAAIILALLFCLDTVDYRPYFRQPYYTETIARLQALQQTNSVVRGELEAGMGRALLTPTLNSSQVDPVHGQFKSLPLAGYASRLGHSATGVHDDVYVKAVAFRVANRLGVMVGADALIVPPEVTELALRQLEANPGLRREQIYLSATHSHSSLGGWGKGHVEEEFAGTFQPGASAWFAACIVAAVRDAVTHLKSATVGYGRFQQPELVKNRLVGSLGKTDPEFSYLLVKQNGGQVAVLGSYSAHATVLPSSMLEFSADYPGAWQRAVEKATGGLAVFLAGEVGSHSPNPGARGIEGAERMGQTLASELLARLPATPMTNSIAFGIIGLDVQLPAFNVRMTDNIRLRPWLASTLIHHSDRTFIQAFRLGASIWISTPCDFSGELALGIKDFLHARNCNAAITSFNGDYVGYVIPSRYYHLNGYEPRLMSFYGPYVADYFDELIRRMASGLAAN